MVGGREEGAPAASSSAKVFTARAGPPEMTGGKRGEGLIREGHVGTRQTLRIVGPTLLVLGILLGAYGLYWATGMGDTKEMGEDGWFEEGRANGTKGMFFIFGGMGTGFLGIVLTKFGYMGAVARYSASEVAPVGTDTINYVGREAQPGLTAIGSAIGSGMGGMATGRGGGTVTMVRCHKCNDENAADAKFCDECGTALAKTKACTSCGELNDPDAKFCDACGTRLT